MVGDLMVDHVIEYLTLQPGVDGYDRKIYRCQTNHPIIDAIRFSLFFALDHTELMWRDDEDRWVA